MKKLKIIVFGLFILLTIFKSVHIPTKIDSAIGQLAVMHDGRVKPMDTVARHYLLQIQGRQRLDGLSPTQWFFDIVSRSNGHNELSIILVEHPNFFDSVDSIYHKQKFRVSESFMDEHISLIQPFITSALQMDEDERTPFLQSAYLVFYRYTMLKDLNLSFFPTYNDSQLQFWNEMLGLSKSFTKDVSPTSPEFIRFTGFYTELQDFSKHHSPLHLVYNNNEWSSLSEIAISQNFSQKDRQYLSDYLLLSDAYHMNDYRLINIYTDRLMTVYESDVSFWQFFQLRLEYYFNFINPFIVSLFLYAIIIGLSFYGSFFNGKITHQLIRYTWGIALAFHSFGIIARILILMRPPVINLYSSATFIAFMASIIGYIIYRRSAMYFYSGYIAALSALSLIVAYHLSLSGDTLAVMEAVLNSNFWLATHVVSMTIGYAIIFMAGFFAISYILIGTLTSRLTPDLEQRISKLVYIFLMIALFFNFLGTILGGIWADQSWGRFWGWDPKENGAILIVLWIAIILHMKWGRLISNRGLMIMTVLSNVVCAWSWKGTNMLGIGLHSYGFTESTFYWLVLFFISQFIVVIMALLPKKYWASKID